MRTCISVCIKLILLLQLYCGGTWQGIINQVQCFASISATRLTAFQLDYIQGMGFTAIWITPVTEQLSQDTGYGEAYHGYWQQKM